MPTYRIGRRTDNDIVIDEPSISRRHAELFDVGDGTYRLRDLESRMGTLVRGPNGWSPIDLVEIDSKTPIRLGNFKTTVAELLDMHARPPISPGRIGYDAPVKKRLKWWVYGAGGALVLLIAGVVMFWGDVPKQRFVDICITSGKIPSLCNCWADAFAPNLEREELLEVAEVIKRGATSDQMNPVLRQKYEALVPYVRNRCPGTQ
jgi:hypothetical protein